MGLLDKLLGNDDDKKKKADFSNVQSGSSSTAPSPAPPAAPPKTSAMGASTSARTYTVVSGDSLSKIAKREYGDATKWRQIFEANRDKITDPDLIHPGQVLTIPSA